MGFVNNRTRPKVLDDGMKFDHLFYGHCRCAATCAVQVHILAGWSTACNTFYCDGSMIKEGSKSAIFGILHRKKCLRNMVKRSIAKQG